MKIVVRESHEGEFEKATTEEFASKLERGIDALRHTCGQDLVAKGGVFFGEVDVLEDLALVLTNAFDDRIKALRKDIVDAVKESAP